MNDADGGLQLLSFMDTVIWGTSNFYIVIEHPTTILIMQKSTPFYVHNVKRMLTIVMCVVLRFFVHALDDVFEMGDDNTAYTCIY